MNEAYLRALKYMHTFNPDIKPFEYWFATILNNAVKDHQRLEREGGINYDVEQITDDFQVAAPASKHKLVKFYQEIEQHHEREILSLFFILGLKPRDIVKIVENRTDHAVKSVVYRFRKEMKDK